MRDLALDEFEVEKPEGRFGIVAFKIVFRAEEALPSGLALALCDGAQCVEAARDGGEESLFAANVDGDGAATYQDLILILGAWGPCGTPCATDLDGNGVTGYQDLLVVLANWFG